MLHEVAAGSLDVGHHAVDYLHHAHRHHFRYRIGEMTGLDRSKRVIHLAASHDTEGREVTPPYGCGAPRPHSIREERMSQSEATAVSSSPFCMMT